MRNEIESLGDNRWERYEEWDVTIPPLPPRSRLYRLEPIGIGTPYVESLTSYIARLAEMHCLSPKTLVKYEILPVQNQPITTSSDYFKLGELWTQNASLNSVGPLARQWVEAIQHLTARDDLHWLTMWTWEQVIAPQRTVRRSKIWCAACYEQWRRNCQTVYEPLLWALNGIDICPQHHQPLVAYCPKCKEAQQFLTQTARPGYCSHCACWLGKDPGLKEIEVAVCDTTENKQKLWNAEVGGKLLAAAPGLSMVPPKEQIPAMLKACLEHYTRGNFRALVRLLNVSRRMLRDYLYHGAVPSFDVLLNICFILSIPPLEFLTGSPDKLQTRPLLVTNHSSAPLRSKRKPIGEGDILYMRQVLAMVLEEGADPFPSVRDIAREIGYHVATLAKYCPDLCQEMNKRYKPSWTSDEIQAHMKAVLEAAVVAEEPIPLKAAAKQLGCTDSTLQRYYPDLCRTIVKRYRQRVDRALIREHLEQVLHSSERAPSIAEIAREMGYSRLAVRNRFPQLCEQISARRRVEQRKLREQRITEICEEIRRVAFMLNSQGIYPSANQVFQQVGDSHAMRRKEEYEAWRQALEELGYPIDHLKKYA